MHSRRRKYAQFGIVIAIIVLGLGYLAYTGVQESKSYYVTLKELNTMGESAYSKRLRVAGGLVWVAFLFAAVVALNQTWARELRNQVLDAYRVSPAPAVSLFLAKAVGNFILVSVLEALMTPLFIVFYNLRSVGPVYQLFLIAVLGTWALVVNGTFFAAISIRTRSREIMLPLILFPISIPALLAMVDGTTSVLTGEASPRFWIQLLAVYDLVFTTVCLALFDTVINAE
jgi:heme exporter protein B